MSKFWELVVTVAVLSIIAGALCTSKPFSGYDRAQDKRIDALERKGQP